jgi:UDP-sulfoquinovose synthase
VFNQFTESFSVLELAELVAALYEGHVRIEHLDNPRVEMDQHYYCAAHDGLLRLGLEPHPLSAALVESAFETVQRHRNRIDPRVILPLSRWKPDLAAQGMPEAAVASGAAIGG